MKRGAGESVTCDDSRAHNAESVDKDKECNSVIQCSCQSPSQ